jgi:hypothetical protein
MKELGGIHGVQTLGGYFILSLALYWTGLVELFYYGDATMLDLWSFVGIFPSFLFNMSMEVYLSGFYCCDC